LVPVLLLKKEGTMPAPRAVLFDIEKNRLNPKKAHKSLGKDGHLEKKKNLAEVSEKPGLVFLNKEEKAEVFAAKKEEVVIPVPVAEKQEPTFEQTAEKLDTFDEEKILEEMLLEEEKSNSEEQKQSTQKAKKLKNTKI
jgi:hypothetical protein